MAGAASDFRMVGVQGDLFTCSPSDSIAHCVSKDLHMTKGLAKKFKDKFGCLDQLAAQDKQVGEVAVLKNGNRYIYYLVMKEQFFDKPTYQTLESSMKAMRDHCLTNNVTRLATPQIGCGLNRLAWSKVSAVINEVFKNTPITITVYHLSNG